MRIYRIRKFPAKVFLLFLIALTILINIKAIPGFRNLAIEVLAKPFKIVSGVKSYFTNKKNLSNKNLLLKQENVTLLVALARMEEVSRENDRLKSLLDFKKSSGYKATIAKVIARDPTDWRQAVIINKGRKDGIRLHMPCATARGLVGTVVEVGITSSKVMLVTDPNSRIGVILESSRESGLLIGSPEGVCKVIYLSLDGKIEKGEKVLTAGFSPFFPKGLAIGTVSKIGHGETGLYKYATLDLFENMNRIEELVCVEIE